MVHRLGVVPYRRAWQLQDRLAAQIASQAQPPTLLLLEHPHVYTFGRRGNAQNLVWDEQARARRGIEVVWADRGGDVTYHGPGQLVGYPLLPLGDIYAGMQSTAGEKTSIASEEHPGLESVMGQRLPGADYVGYLRKLEEMLILALLRLGVAGGQLPGLTGVWVQPHVPSRCKRCAPSLRQPMAKLAAIGVKVDARGISRHGFALNVDPDMSYWDGIIGCGLKDYASTSLAELRSPPPDMEAVMEAVIAAFGEVFGYEMVADNPPPGWESEESPG
jgi:lipoyl(octanoyl) transferase